MDPSYATDALLWGERLFWAAILILSNWFTSWIVFKASGQDTLKLVVEHDAVIITELGDLVKAQSAWADQMQEHQQKSLQNAGWIAKSIVDASNSGARNNGASPDGMGERTILEPPPNQEPAKDPAEKVTGSDRGL